MEVRELLQREVMLAASRRARLPNLVTDLAVLSFDELTLSELCEMAVWYGVSAARVVEICAPELASR